MKGKGGRGGGGEGRGWERVGGRVMLLLYSHPKKGIGPAETTALALKNHYMPLPWEEMI